MDVNCSKRREKSVLLQYKPSNGGEGWCLVSVYLQGAGKLGIHYECLADKSDEELALTEMRSVEDLYANFRLPSSQLKDNKCSKLIEGWPIVVSYSPAEQGGPIEDTGRKLYFDARLEKGVHVHLHLAPTFRRWESMMGKYAAIEMMHQMGAMTAYFPVIKMCKNEMHVHTLQLES